MEGLLSQPVVHVSVLNPIIFVLSKKNGQTGSKQLPCRRQKNLIICSFWPACGPKTAESKDLFLSLAELIQCGIVQKLLLDSPKEKNIGYLL
jgi:hypothetical protein